MKYYIYWWSTRARTEGFETFELKYKAEEKLLELQGFYPDVKFRVIVGKEIKVNKIEVATKFEIDE